jgi:Flp pilus assembly protein TadD
MVETVSSAPSLASPSRTDDSRVVLDIVLAGLICFATVSYWFWDNHNAAGNMAANVVTASQPTSENRSSNDNGYRLFLASDYVAAESQFRKAIGENPTGALGFCNLGAALIGEQRFDEAIVALNTALALDPSLNLARNNLNWALQEKAKHAK